MKTRSKKGGSMVKERCFACYSQKWHWFEGDLTTRFIQLVFYVLAAAFVFGVASWLM